MLIPLAIIWRGTYLLCKGMSQSHVPDLRVQLLSQLQSIAALWPVPNYTYV